MDRDASLELSARIGAIIAGRAPIVRYTDADVRRAEAECAADLAEMRGLGLVGDSFEEYYVIREFLASCGADRADGHYLLRLFAEARLLDADEFERDPYLQNIAVADDADGDILLTTSSYSRGEIFQYDMPDFAAPLVVPKLGFFTREVRFPAIYEDGVPWVSVCPSEINSMSPDIPAAHGRVLVLGLGLGYYAYRVSELAAVDSVTVVEINPKIAAIFRRRILPQFPHAAKVTVAEADAFDFLASLRGGEFDFCYADIWEGVLDGARAYLRIKPHEKRLEGTRFRYWIEPQIRAYLGLKR